MGGGWNAENCKKMQRKQHFKLGSQHQIAGQQVSKEGIGQQRKLEGRWDARKGMGGCRNAENCKKMQRKQHLKLASQHKIAGQQGRYRSARKIKRSLGCKESHGRLLECRKLQEIAKKKHFKSAIQHKIAGQQVSKDGKNGDNPMGNGLRKSQKKFQFSRSKIVDRRRRIAK